MEKEKEKKDLEERIKKAESTLKTLTESKRLLITIIIVVAALFLIVNKLTSKPGKTTIDITSVMEDRRIISELSTLQIPYSNIYRAEEKKKNENDKTKYKYYVKYDGFVKLGLNLEKVKIEENIKLKEVHVKLPKIQINDANVELDSIQIIYENNKYNKEGHLFDVRKECQEDMNTKIKNNKDYYKMAEESAITTIKNFLDPVGNKLNKIIIVEIDENGNEE